MNCIVEALHQVTFTGLKSKKYRIVYREKLNNESKERSCINTESDRNKLYSTVLSGPRIWLADKSAILESNRTPTAVSPFVSLRLPKLLYFSQRMSCYNTWHIIHVIITSMLYIRALSLYFWLNCQQLLWWLLLLFIKYYNSINYIFYK